VTFENDAGATLNRATGGSPTAIFGKLAETGGPYVINPQGGRGDFNGRFPAVANTLWETI
jgi:filamentous hemagglutinin family protein